MNTKKKSSPGLRGYGFKARQTSKGSLVKDLLNYFKVLIVLTCKINIVAVMNTFLFLYTDKAANGPASKKSKTENKKGKTTASVNENVIKAVVVFLVLNDYEMRQSSVGKKDGDWYICPQFLAHENFNNVHKKVQKSYKIFKPTIHNVLTAGTNIVKIWLSLRLIRCVRFARYCCKMYSRHLFSYGGLLPTLNVVRF